MLSEHASKTLECALRDGLLTLTADTDGRYRTASFEGAADQFESICEIADLIDLSCNYSLITDEVFPSLTKLVNLRKLSFIGTAITGRAYGVLRELKQLTEIFCVPEKGTAEAATSLAQCTGLRILDLAGSSFLNDDVNVVLSLPDLERFSVDSCPLSDGSFENIGACRRLIRVAASSNRLGDETCQHLASCRTLRDITLGEAEMTGYGLRQIGSLPRLQRECCCDRHH